MVNNKDLKEKKKKRKQCLKVASNKTCTYAYATFRFPPTYVYA